LLDILVQFRDYSLSVVKKYAKTFFVDFSWAIDAVIAQCACAVSCDLGVGVKSDHIFGICDPNLFIHCTTKYNDGD